MRWGFFGASLSKQVTWLAFFCADLAQQGIVMATKTARRPKKSRTFELSKRRAEIYRDGKLVDVNEQNDPRQRFYELMNKMGHGFDARPVPAAQVEKPPDKELFVVVRTEDKKRKTVSVTMSRRAATKYTNAAGQGDRRVVVKRVWGKPA
jgi:hypothetical protein